MLRNKFINDPQKCIEEMLQGYTKCYSSHVKLLESSPNVVVRSDWEQHSKQCALISGGGSGHEPSHAGFVGKGMLTAAVCGNIFASPDVQSILKSILYVSKNLQNPYGTLLIVKNYTGDVLNFGLAMELAKTKHHLNVDMLVVGEDCALDTTEEDRRGLAGTVLIHKIMGALAEKKYPLDELKRIGESIVSSKLRTIGVSLNCCIVPGNSKPAFTLQENEMCIGLGIHGEQGAKICPIQASDQIASTLLQDYLLKQLEWKQVAILINNLGSVTPMELHIIANKCVDLLEENSIVVERVIVGTFMTSLDMKGYSISLLETSNHLFDVSNLCTLLDEPVDCIGWNSSSVLSKSINTNVSRSNFIYTNSALLTDDANSFLPSVEKLEIDHSTWNHFISALYKICKEAKEREDDFCQKDALVGDADLGHSLRMAADRIEAILKLSSSQQQQSLSHLLLQISEAVQSVGGSSGVLLSVWCLRLSKYFSTSSHCQLLETNPRRAFAEAIEEANQGLAQLGKAKRGDRTMLDALIPLQEALADDSLSLETVVQKVKIAVEETKELTPKKGRSRYLKDKAIGNVDPGAYAISCLVAAVLVES